MVEPLRHRQTKGAATDMPGLPPPRHIPTLPIAAIRSLSRPSIALDPIGHSVELVLSTLSRPSWLLQRVVGSTRKQPFTLGLHQLRPARREAPLPLSGRRCRTPR